MALSVYFCARIDSLRELRGPRSLLETQCHGHFLGETMRALVRVYKRRIKCVELPSVVVERATAYQHGGSAFLGDPR